DKFMSFKDREEELLKHFSSIYEVKEIKSQSKNEIDKLNNELIMLKDKLKNVESKENINNDSNNKMVIDINTIDKFSTIMMIVKDIKLYKEIENRLSDLALIYIDYMDKILSQSKSNNDSQDNDDYNDNQHTTPT